MASACTNPLLYGFLNESFKKEFEEMYAFAFIKNVVQLLYMDNPETTLTTKYWMNWGRHPLQHFLGASFLLKKSTFEYALFWPYFGSILAQCKKLWIFMDAFPQQFKNQNVKKNPGWGSWMWRWRNQRTGIPGCNPISIPVKRTQES